MKVLSEISNEVRDLYEPRPDEHFPYVGLEHIDQGTLQLNGSGLSSETQSTKKKFRADDILFGSLRPYFRKVVRPKFDGVCSTDITVIRANETADQGFLNYLIADQSFIDYATAASNGTRMPRANWGVVRNFEFILPLIETQHRIASILSAYDDLIENNTRRIAILEEMARRIYEEWFVRFRFPGHEQVKMVESELGLIPEGWELMKLGNLIEFKKGKKPAVVSDQKSNGLLPHLLIDALRGGDRSEFVSPEKMVLTRADDTIMVMDGSGSCDVFVGYEGAIGSTLGRYRVMAEKGVTPFWLFLFFSTNFAELKAKNIGAAIPHANKDFIHGKVVAVADEKITQSFEQLVCPMYQLGRTLRNMSANLRTTRDLLLPKLISGELDVSNLPEPESIVA